jgi:hypothetical protein
MNMHRVTLHVFEFNDRRWPVTGRAGSEEGRYREEYFQDGRYWDIVRMGVLRHEFEALHGTVAEVAHLARRPQVQAGLKPCSYEP